MDSIRTRNPQAALMLLEAAATSARGGFACMFSSSEEFETALISERRAQGRYDQRRTRWPAILFIGCALMLVGTVLLFG
jgi:DNA invertase Pin-like site-specific DNA recombinase